MKATATMLPAAVLLLISSRAFAAGGFGTTASVAAWVFLAFCALIAVAQLMPALVVLAGIVKQVLRPSGASHANNERSK